MPTTHGSWVVILVGTMVTCDPIIRTLATLFYPVTCNPIIRSPATLSLYLHSPPCVPPYNGLHSTSLFTLPPCVPLNHCLHSTSWFELPPPAFHYTMVSIPLLYLNFPPCVPLRHCLHSTSLLKLFLPLRSTKTWSPFYFLISTSPPLRFHWYHGLHSTSLFKLPPPLRSTKPWSPFYFFI